MDDGAAGAGAHGVPTRDVIAQLIAFLWRWRWLVLLMGLAVALLIRIDWSPGKTIVVTFDGAGAEERPLLLYSGMRAGRCRAFEPWVGAPSVTLTDVKYGASCPTEIDVFARGHGADAYAVDPAKPGSERWFTDALSSGALTWHFPDLTPVPLTLWLVADGPRDLATVEAKRDDLTAWATARFDAEGAGIMLEIVSKQIATSAVGEDCSAAAAIFGNSSIFDAGRINVYLVEWYGSSGSSTTAYNCVDVGHKEIAFIAWGNPNLRDAALTHELGHSLGLSRPTAVWGHTEGVAGFDSKNIMWPGGDAMHITVGQLYGIHFSDVSWLHGTGPSSVQPLVRTCQNAWGPPPPCPHLSQALTGWPPP